MAPPPMTTSLQLTSALQPLVYPTTTLTPFISIFDDLQENHNVAPVITTVENDITCGWYSGVTSHAFQCSTPLSCATNTDNVIACSQKSGKNIFYSACIDLVHATEEGCSVSGVLCCNSINPSCMTLLWTASPTRSLVGCNAIDSTWVMLDYPFELDTATAINTGASHDSTPVSSTVAHTTVPTSSKGTPPSDASQPPTTSGMYSSDGGVPTTASSLPVSPTNPPSGHAVTKSAVPSSASSPIISLTLPAPDSPSGSLTTGAKAGIGVGASMGLLIILTPFAVFFFKKRQARAAEQSEKTHNSTGRPLQDNPSGELPATIAPPARLARSSSTAWNSNYNHNNDNNNNTNNYDLADGSSEVPVDMRGQGVGAVELPGSPVNMAPIGIAQRRYDEYQTQAPQYRRFSQISRDPQGAVSYRSAPRDHGPWSGPTF